MAENLLRQTWAALDQADLGLLLMKRFAEGGGLGQYGENTAYFPSAGERCRIYLTWDKKDAKIVEIAPGAAFDRQEWNDVCAEIEGPIMKGPRKIGRWLSFNTRHVNGWWRGEQSKVQILPPPEDAPQASENADNPFVLEFPIRDAGEWPKTNSFITVQRLKREHQKLTLLLNVLLRGTTKFLSQRHKHFWARVGAEQETQWVVEGYNENIGEAVIQDLSAPVSQKLEALPSNSYYERESGLHEQGMRVPDDLDESICRYQSLSPLLQAKFDRAAYWLSMARRQWEESMSASYASLVSAAEALTPEFRTKHYVYCEECKKKVSHDVPGATEKFRAFFEKYTPDPGLIKRRNQMYDLRSRILHGAGLMQLDQCRAFGWEPAWLDEEAMNTELWGLMRTATRNWLKDPT